MKKKIWFRGVAFVLAFVLASMVTVRIYDKPPAPTAKEGSATVEIAVPEAHGFSWCPSTVVTIRPE